VVDPAAGTPRWAPVVTLPLSLLGLGLSIYLTVVHYTEPASLSCPSTGAINCTKVTTSAQSMLFGHIPVALAGAVFFLGMTALSLPAAWHLASRSLAMTRVAFAVAGMAMVMWLIYAEAVIVHALCLWCTAVHVVMFALFVCVLAATTWGGALDGHSYDGPEDAGDARPRQTPAAAAENTRPG
jgi:uncharacterized membrane protein